MMLTRADNKLIRELVELYKEKEDSLKTFLSILQSLFLNSKELVSVVHSFKWRLKDSEHLREKLRRKLIASRRQGGEFAVDASNLFVEINDLVGVRILHLHTRQATKIDKILRGLLAESRLRIIEGPFARTWDDETKAFFKENGIKTLESGPSMYTSVHYVIDSSSRTRLTAEIQVRTLAEELWGEVAHVIDYPSPSESLACQEQIRVLARVASSCTRLVDAIFKTHDDFKNSTGRIRARKKLS